MHKESSKNIWKERNVLFHGIMVTSWNVGFPSHSPWSTSNMKFKKVVLNDTVFIKCYNRLNCAPQKIYPPDISEYNPIWNNVLLYIFN